MMKIKYSQRILYCFIVRLIAAFILLSSFFYYIGPYYTKLYIPMFTRSIEYIDSTYEVLDVNLSTTNNIEQLQYKIRTHQTFIDEQGKIWPSSDATVGVQSYLLYVLPIIIYSLLLAWPLLSLKKKLTAALIPLPFLIIIQLIDVPINLLYSLKESYNFDSLPIHLEIHWYHKLLYDFFNIGGRQFVALIIFLLSIVPFHLNDQKSKQ